MKIGGYAGNILRVDLSKREINKERLHMGLAKDFIGGFGIGAKLAYDLIKPSIAPLSPENSIIISAGPLVGTSAPASSRFDAFTKFPQNSAVYPAGGGMSFGTKLKYAGYDLLIISGRADKPVYLKVIDDDVEICNAEGLWGNDIFQTTDELRGKYGKTCSVISIGQAGENLANLSLTLVDKSSTLGRGGFAAVMGSKNLKAIVADGTKGVTVSEPERFMRLANRLIDAMVGWPPREEFIRLGHQMYDFDAGPPLSGRVNYWRETVDADRCRETYGPQAYLQRIKKRRVACPSCPIACRDILEITEGEYEGTRTYAHGIVGRIMDLGIRLGVESLEEVVKCLDLSQRYGVDIISLAGVVEILVDLFEQGIITKRDTGGLVPQKGFNAVAKYIEMITFRKGIGDALADGIPGIVGRFGEYSRQYAVDFKSMDLHVDARLVKLGTAQFSQATDPKGYGKGGTLNPGKFDPHASMEKFERFCDETLCVPKEAKGRIFASPYKLNIGRLTRYTEDYYCASSCLGICARLHIAQFYPMPILAELYSAATGIEIGVGELQTAAERVWNLHKLTNVREGFTRKDDKFPQRYLEPLKHEGKEVRMMDFAETRVLTADDLEKLLDDYYDERGWDIKTGTPTQDKLRALGLLL